VAESVTKVDSVSSYFSTTELSSISIYLWVIILRNVPLGMSSGTHWKPCDEMDSFTGKDLAIFVWCTQTPRYSYRVKFFG
jgi:hypothetical protein